MEKAEPEKEDKYSHLDNATLGQFIVEFARRNESLIQDYKKLPKQHWNGQGEFYKKYKVFPAFAKRRDPRLRKWSPEEEAARPDFVIPHTFSIQLFPKDHQIDDEDREKWEWDEDSVGYSVQYSKAGVDSKISNVNRTDVSCLLRSLLGTPDDDGYYPCQDIMLLRINLNDSLERIREDIDKILNAVKLKGPKFRPKEWKMYLMTYDFIMQNPDMTFREISDELSELYPDITVFHLERNIENYYKNAKALINGGYKQYI